MRFDILTIFPNIFDSYLNESILKRAKKNGLIDIHVHNIRDFTENKYNKVDDIPFGGGAGMVMLAQPIYDAVQHVKKFNKGPVIYLSPKGKTLTQTLAEKLSKKGEDMILICGRYEGIDQRAIDLCVDMEISIGKYVLTGGELGAMVIIDTVSRLIPGVLGSEESHQEDTFSKSINRKKEYPHYTRPAVFKNLKVPDVLMSGNHKEIAKWRKNLLK